MLTCLVYEKGALRTDVPFEEIDQVLARPETLVWLDVMDGVEGDLEVLRREFGFHPLSLEDALHGQQRPKLEEYEGYCFLAAQAAQYDAEACVLRFVEVDLFVGRNYVVTVHKEPEKAIDESVARCHRNPEILREGVGFLVYTLMDSIIDAYLPVLDQMSEQVDEIEERVFACLDDSAIQDIFRLKRAMLQIRRMTGHLRDVFNVLMRRDQPLFAPQTLVYFRDIYDHLYRITDSVDIYRDVLSGALEAWLSLSANRLNGIMKIFAGLSIMLMTSALVAGIYGMNFQFMPELKWPFGYAFSLGMMGLLVFAEFRIFRKKGWL